MSSFSLVSRFLKGSRLTYLTAIFSVVCHVGLAALLPLVIRVTLDSILGDEPLSLPAPIINLLDSYGGVQFIRDRLWLILVILIGLTLLQGIFQYMRTMLASLTGENSAKRMRDRLYRHLLKQPYDYHVQTQTGDLIQRCTSDVETAQRFIANRSVEAIAVIIQVIVVLWFLFSMHAWYAAISIAIIPIIQILTVRFFRTMSIVFRQADEAEGEMSTAFQESLSGIRVVKAFAAQSFEIEKIERASGEYRDQSMNITNLMSRFWSQSDFLCMLQFVLVVVAGVYFMAVGQITLGVLVAFTTYSGMLIWPIRGLGQMMGFMSQAFIALSRIQDILDQPGEDQTSGISDKPIKGAISFNQVSFGYDKDRPVLNRISFDVPAGSTTAILGTTGSGKSSLVHLLLRLYDYQSGSITIDGIELSSISRSWIRANIGIVLQEPFLFSRTIKENIRIGHPEFSDAQIRSATKTAFIDSSIRSFEQGYNTMVGERGVTLSGGQRQRLAIARIILKDLPILIFDDALSAVDTQTDAAIRQALAQRQQKATTLIIAQRITTLSQADQIIVLDKGRIVQKGTHQELIARDGYYRQIWAMQSDLSSTAGPELE